MLFVTGADLFLWLRVTYVASQRVKHVLREETCQTTFQLYMRSTNIDFTFEYIKENVLLGRITPKFGFEIGLYCLFIFLTLADCALLSGIELSK